MARAVAGGLTLVALLTQAADSDVRRDAVVEAVEAVMPCVANINTEEVVDSRDPFDQIFRDFWDPYYRRRPRDKRYSLGSGVIIDEEGYLLTNMHVVQRARKVWVQLSDGREFEARPRIVGTGRTDVALLKLVTPKDEKFRAVKFAQDNDLLLGETVLALGNPFGLGVSVSRGILSSKNRRPPREGEPLDLADWLQTDAAINPGSSGGPLVNLRGELIGLNVAIYREGQGIGFAIPVKQVLEALSELASPEVDQSLWFGARLHAGPPPFPVTTVLPGSPADQAGLRVGDTIVSVNGRSPRRFLEVMRWIGESPQQEATLAVQRDGGRRTLKVTLRPLAELIRQKLGLSVQELTADLGRTFGYRPGDGLLIADVDRDGPTARAELRPGSLLTAIDGQATPDLVNAAAVLASRRVGETVELAVAAWQQRGPFARLSQGVVQIRIR